MADGKWANDEPQGQLPLAGFLQGLMQGGDGIDNGQNKAVSWEMRNNFWAKALSRSEFFKARKILNYWLILEVHKPCSGDCVHARDSELTGWVAHGKDWERGTAQACVAGEYPNSEGIYVGCQACTW